MVVAVLLARRPHVRDAKRHLGIEAAQRLVAALPVRAGDEPTTALGVEETRKVLELVREMREQGLSVVMISHNLAHVFDLCDRISVMKTGVVAGSRHASQTDRDEILRLIVTGGA